MFGAAQRGARTKRLPKLHSIAAVLRERSFEGSFEIAGASYGFSYRPMNAAIRNGKLQINGNLTIGDRRSGLRATSRDLANVRATLASTQGGIGTAPPRRKLPSDVGTVSSVLPIVESTGSLSFCGVLYFKLAPLDARALGLPADMSNAQLNARLAPRSDIERSLQGAYSSIVDALHGKEMEAAQAAVSELNNLLSTR